MAILSILKFPHPVLREKASPIPAVTPKLRALAGDMVDTMKHARGVGLAAPQVGYSLRLIVIDAHSGGAYTLFNPEVAVVSEGEFSEREEGCLSIPGVTSVVRRPSRVSISGMNEDGKQIRIEGAEGLLAACLQHEIDHLNGVLFIDHLSRLKRARILSKYHKLQRESEG